MDGINRKWLGDKLWYLVNLETNKLKEVFPEYSWDGLRAKRKKYRKILREGKELPPPIPVDYKPSDTALEIRERINEFEKLRENREVIADATQDLIDIQMRQKLHDLLDRTIDKANINPAHVSKLRLNTGHHIGYIKNSDNEIEYTEPLEKANISFVVEPEKFEHKWVPIDHVICDVSYIPEPKQFKKTKMKTCVVLPDPQIGFWKYQDNSLDTMHDENAISVALQVVSDLKPEKVVILGDLLDVAMFGRYGQEAAFAHTAQMAINYAFRMIAMIRATLPSSEIVVIEGNHDRRLENYVKTNSMNAYNIRRADDTTGWPVFSVPYLLSFDTLNIKYIDGYPAGRYWINQNLQCIHGHIVRQAGQTAPAVVKTETVSTIFGHIHRIETAYDTQNVYGGARANLAHSPGALCRIDGWVPSVKGSTGLDGKPVTNYENWQNGLAVVDYEEGNGPFTLHSVYINTHQGYKTSYNGKLYTPDKKLIKELNKIQTI